MTTETRHFSSSSTTAATAETGVRRADFESSGRVGTTETRIWRDEGSAHSVSGRETQGAAIIGGFSEESMTTLEIHDRTSVGFGGRVQKMARGLSSRIGEERERQLYERRIELVQKSLAGELSSRERAILQGIEWKLDQIELARGGDSLTALERIVTIFERIGDEINREAKTASKRERENGTRGKRR